MGNKIKKKEKCFSWKNGELKLKVESNVNNNPGEREGFTFTGIWWPICVKSSKSDLYIWSQSKQAVEYALIIFQLFLRPIPFKNDIPIGQILWFFFKRINDRNSWWKLVQAGGMPVQVYSFSPGKYFLSFQCREFVVFSFNESMLENSWVETAIWWQLVEWPLQVYSFFSLC